mgnify:FL=1
MRIKSKSALYKGFTLFISLIILLWGCNSGDELKDTIDEEKTDSAASNVLELGNVVFCIPSPIQTAILVKDVGASYDKKLLNSPGNKSSYSTNFQKALNLGVYGADLGYVTIYEQPQDGISYLNTIKDLADDIGVASAFSPEIMKRISENIGNQDSLLNMVSSCYRSLNAFLKENERDDVCALVLAGGWIESTFFVTRISGILKSQELVNRIGEQKSTLNNLIKLIEPFYNDPQFTELLDQLYDLADDFDGVVVEYEYAKPTVNESKKLTIINSKSKVTITEEEIQVIREKIEALRNQIVG